MSFRDVLAVGLGFGVVGTVAQHALYDAREDSIGDSFDGIDQIRRDLAGAFVGYLLGIEMLVALLTMTPAARAAERVGLKPVVAVGFAVYATFLSLDQRDDPTTGVTYMRECH